MMRQSMQALAPFYWEGSPGVIPHSVMHGGPAD